MRNNIKLALFYILILGLFSILLCTENSIWFSASIAMICTSTGVCIGQLIKKRKRFHASTDKLWGFQASTEKSVRSVTIHLPLATSAVCAIETRLPRSSSRKI